MRNTRKVFASKGDDLIKKIKTWYAGARKTVKQEPHNSLEYLDAMRKDMAEVLKSYGIRVQATRSMPRRRTIRANEYYPEDYFDLGYDNLDLAHDSIYTLENSIDELGGLLIEARELVDSPIEAFSGPDEADKFANDVYDVCDMLDRAAKKLSDIIG